jgi:hypothetical protein
MALLPFDVDDPRLLPFCVDCVGLPSDKSIPLPLLGNTDTARITLYGDDVLYSDLTLDACGQSRP